MGISSIAAVTSRLVPLMCGIFFAESLEKSRKDAEKRLHSKASDLAGKLNEAATMLSSLVSPKTQVDRDLQVEEG